MHETLSSPCRDCVGRAARAARGGCDDRLRGRRISDVDCGKREAATRFEGSRGRGPSRGQAATVPARLDRSAARARGDGAARARARARGGGRASPRAGWRPYSARRASSGRRRLRERGVLDAHGPDGRGGNPWGAARLVHRRGISEGLRLRGRPPSRRLRCAEACSCRLEPHVGGAVDDLVAAAAGKLGAAHGGERPAARAVRQHRQLGARSGREGAVRADRERPADRRRAV